MPQTEKKIANNIAIASDHAGVDMKVLLKHELKALGYEVNDLGTHSTDSVDYPDYAHAMAAELKSGNSNRGILLCGTGIGISIAANRHKQIRAALCHQSLEAKMARKHNDANVLVMGARMIGIEAAKDCMRSFLTTDFEAGRHKKRVDKINA